MEENCDSYKLMSETPQLTTSITSAKERDSLLMVTADTTTTEDTHPTSEILRPPALPMVTDTTPQIEQKWSRITYRPITFRSQSDTDISKATKDIAKPKSSTMEDLEQLPSATTISPQVGSITAAEQELITAPIPMVSPLTMVKTQVGSTTAKDQELITAPIPVVSPLPMVKPVADPIECTKSASTDQLNAAIPMVTDPELTTDTSKSDEITSQKLLEVTKPKSIYYEVLTTDEEDIISISHDDIISNKCDVTLDKLSDQDIEDIQVYMRGEQECPEETINIKLPRHLKEQKRKLSHRPSRKPSKDQIKAKKMIQEHNIKIRKKELLPTPLRINP